MLITFFTCTRCCKQETFSTPCLATRLGAYILLASKNAWVYHKSEVLLCVFVGLRCLSKSSWPVEGQARTLINNAPANKEPTAKFDRESLAARDLQFPANDYRNTTPPTTPEAPRRAALRRAAPSKTNSTVLTRYFGISLRIAPRTPFRRSLVNNNPPFISVHSSVWISFNI